MSQNSPRFGVSDSTDQAAVSSINPSSNEELQHTTIKTYLGKVHH